MNTGHPRKSENEGHKNGHYLFDLEDVAESSHLIDRISERIAYERIVIRLYDTILLKHSEATHRDHLPPYELIKQFHQEEVAHYRLLCEVMRKLGGDPNAITASGNRETVAAHGWIEVVTHPDSTFDQCLHILHLAELGDSDSWELLTEFAEAQGLQELASKFRSCQAEEDNHLLNVRNWIRAHNLPDTQH